MNYKLLLFGFLSLGFARISAQTFPLHIEESSQTQLYEIQKPNHPSSPVGQAKLTRKELKARGACFYCKNEEHVIRECPKKRLDRLKKKTVKQDPNNNPEDQPAISTMMKIA